MATNTQIEWLTSQLVATESLLAATGDNPVMRISLEKRIARLKRQIEEARHLPDEAKLSVWFSGKGVYGSSGIEQGFMESTSKSIVGMINASTRQTVRKLREAKKKADMPKGQFYITNLMRGSFGYELAFRDEQGSLFEDTAIIDSIHNVMGVLDVATEKGVNVDELIKEQPIRLLSNLKDLLCTLNKKKSILKMESGHSTLELNLPRVNTGYDNICSKDILEKPDVILGTFKGAFIESGKFEYTDEEGKVKHGDISDDLSGDQIADFNKLFSQKECRMNVIKEIVSYTNGKKKESVELVGIEDTVEN